MELEQWKMVPDYEGMYMVSNLGRVKSLNYMKTGKEALMYTRKNKIGRIVVRLSKNGKYYYPTVHRLVALAFIPNTENKPEVHHIDKNPLNNCVDNLMWVTKKEHAALHPEHYKKRMSGRFTSSTRRFSPD